MTPRDRVLSDAEVLLVWQAFESVGWPFGPIGKLLFLTGARLNEIAGIGMAQSSISGRAWTLPASRGPRTSRRNVIPLSALPSRLSESLPDHRAQEVCLHDDTQVAGERLFERQGEHRLRLENGRWRGSGADSALASHDIRRTVRDRSAEGSESDLEVTEAFLNHVAGAAAASSASICATTGLSRSARP